MKVKIEKSDFVGLISKTLNVVEKKNSMPVLSNILLEARGGTLKIFATDLEVSLTDEIDAKVEQEGQVVVSAKNLFDICRELGDGEIELVKNQNNWLHIKKGRADFDIVGVNPEEYPVFPSYTARDFTKIQPEVLGDMIEKTIYSVSTDETRYHLNGVFFEQHQTDAGTRYRMVATDGHRLSLVDRKIKEEELPVFPAGVIVPKKGLAEVRKLLDSTMGLVEMAMEGSQLILKAGRSVLMVRLIEGKYPNYQQLIPQNLKRHAQVSRELLVSSLKRVSLLSNQKSKSVTLTLKPGLMQVSSNNPELGNAKEEFEINYTGEELKIGFNAKYLLDILNTFNDDDVDVEFNDQLSPGLLRPHNDAQYTCVVMPMRI